MKFILFIISVALLGLNLGCQNLTNITGANEGERTDNNLMKYRVLHPGLNITLYYPYSSDLIPISTIGKKSNKSLHHTIVYGTKSNQHKLLLIGSIIKEIYLDGKFYGSVRFGDLVIKENVVIIDGEVIAPKATS